MKRIIIFFGFLGGFLSAQTAPVAPQSQPEINFIGGNQYSFSWESVPNRVYFMQVSSQPASSEGFSWEYVPDIRVGDGTPLSMGFEANSANSEFFRLVYVDYFGTEDPNLLDFDGDGYTNGEEANANTSSFDSADFPGGTLGSQDSNGGSPTSGGGGNNQPWEYKLIFKVGTVSTDIIVNENNPVPDLTYPLEGQIPTEITFVNLEGKSQACFVQVEPNLDHDPSDSNSNPHKVIGVVHLDEDNDSWNRTGDAGSGVEGKLFPLEVVVPKLDGQGLEVDGQLTIARELKVAKMGGADLIDFGQGEQVYEFQINDDRDRFYIRARNLPTDLGEVSVFFQTGHPTLADYRDVKTELELEAQPGGAIRVTKSQVLMSDNPDDDYSQDSRIDEIDMFVDELKNERSHITSLRGLTRVASLKHDGKEHVASLDHAVRPRKKVTVKVYRIKKQNMGLPMVALAVVKKHLKALKERYAQIGLEIIVDGPHIKNIPNNINLDDGYQIQDFDKVGVVQEETDFIAEVASVGADDIEIFYVPKITDFSDQNLVTAGYAYVPSKFPNNAFHNNIVISGLANDYVLAHELGHILLNDGGHDDDFNLMSASVNTMSANAIKNDKRLGIAQENQIYSHPLVEEVQ